MYQPDPHPMNDLMEDKQTLLADLGLCKLKIAGSSTSEEEGLMYLGMGLGTLGRHLVWLTISEEEAGVLRQELCDIFLTRWPHNIELFGNHGVNGFAASRS